MQKPYNNSNFGENQQLMILDNLKNNQQSLFDGT